MRECGDLSRVYLMENSAWTTRCVCCSTVLLQPEALSIISQNKFFNLWPQVILKHVAPNREFWAVEGSVGESFWDNVVWHMLTDGNVLRCYFTKSQWKPIVEGSLNYISHAAQGSMGTITWQPCSCRFESSLFKSSMLKLYQCTKTGHITSHAQCRIFFWSFN